MTSSKKSQPTHQSHTPPTNERSGGGGSADDDVHAAYTREKEDKLLAGVDEDVDQLREGMPNILTDHTALQTSGHSGQVLEELVVSLRLANEHLVISSLTANTRETEAAEAHQRQSEFLSMLAHELRNPLAPIATSVELMGRMTGLSPELKSLQRILARQTTHLTRLVEDLMDITRISSGKITLRKRPILLAKFMEQAIETSQPLLDKHRQPVHVALPMAPIWINGDLDRLVQLFSNLIINASQFSDDGCPVVISAQRDGGNVIVSVKDEGMGIAVERQPFIFDLFTQGPVAGGRMASGLGVGLSLVQTIAQHHGGTVRVVSQGIGHGCEFIVLLPALEGEPLPAAELAHGPALEATPNPKMPSGRAMRVVLIDDNADVVYSLSELLVHAGHLVDCALDGATGVRMGSLKHYDFICCDIGLPDITGYEVARQLSASPSTACLIAISGFDQQDQKDQALSAGFDHYLVKPIFGEELLELLT
jgi:two-component system CheB/CheR fusion protein